MTMDETVVFPVLFLVAPVLILGSTLVALYVAGRRHRHASRLASLERRRAEERQIAVEAQRSRRLERETALDALARAYDAHQDLIDQFLRTAQGRHAALQGDGSESPALVSDLILDCLLKIGAREGLTAPQVESALRSGLDQPERAEIALSADPSKRRLIQDLARHLDSDFRLALEESARNSPPA
jgi:Flp pilus assembly protein TadB